ncbi:MAG: tetratricopeptide repeat protein, partial [Firmicutes bacterium]|nr:tetratricopeptide repeat protein [Bacillota bacterium]
LRYIVMSYQAAGQAEEALDVARLGLRFFPNYADLYYYSGLLYLELKRYALARESFQRAVSMPEQPAQYASFGGVKGFRSYYHLGQIDEVFLNYEDAVRYYVLCLRDNPDFTPALENIVRILKPRENPDYAKKCLEKVFEFSTPRANQIMGDIYFRQGAYSLALEYFNRYTDSEPASPETQLWKAICLIQLRRYLEALRIIESFNSGSHLYPLAMLNKLFCFWVQGKKQKVRSILAELRTLGLAEDTDKVLTLFLNAQDKRRNTTRVTLGRDGTDLLLDIIKRLLDMNETDRVMYLLNKVSPESLAGHRLCVARLFYDFGYKEKAETLLREYLTAKQDGEAHYLLAEICRENGRYIEAGQHYRYAVELNPDEPRYYISQISLYDNWRKRILHEAIEKYPDIEVFIKYSEEAPVN